MDGKNAAGDDDARAKIQGYALESFNAFLGLMVLLGGGYFALTLFLKKQVFAKTIGPDAVFRFSADSPIFSLIPAVLFGFGISAFILRKYYKKKLGAEAESFFEIQRRAGYLRWDYGGSKVAPSFMAISFLLFELMGFRYFTAVYPDRVEFSPAMSLSTKVIEFKSISTIRYYEKSEAPNGKILNKFVFELEGNGHFFSSYDALISDRGVSEQTVLRYIEGQSGLQAEDGGVHDRKFFDIGK